MEKKIIKKKMDKKDHSVMTNTARVVKGGVLVLGMAVSVIPGLRRISNILRKK